MLIIPWGGGATTVEMLEQNLHTIQMNGQEVYRFATCVFPAAVER